MARLAARQLLAGVKIAGLAIAVLGCVPSAAPAQPIAGSMLKAAFMLNFVKFTEWPARKPELPILICVSGDELIADALTRTVNGQRVDGRAIQVIARGDSVRDCQVLFVAEPESRLAEILQEASQFPVLTISDINQAAMQGAMIEFFLEKDRLRFAVNVDTMARSRIKLSSRVLTLAVIVRAGLVQ